jgi:hypothetical protein
MAGAARRHEHAHPNPHDRHEAGHLALPNSIQLLADEVIERRCGAAFGQNFVPNGMPCFPVFQVSVAALHVSQ